MFSSVLEGLKILAKYLPDTDGYYVGAEHDELYVYEVKTDEITEEDRKRLEELGWDQGEDEGVWERYV